MSFKIIEDEESKKIYLTYGDNDCCFDEVTYEIVEECNISPYDLFSILNEFGQWNNDRLEYCFDSYETAGKAVDKIKSYQLMDKITE